MILLVNCILLCQPDSQEGVTPVMRPFDARQSWLDEGAAPATGWRTVSLVTAVRALVDFDGPTPAPGKADTLRSCLDALTARGIDGDSLVRYGLAPELISPLLFRMVLGPTLAPEERAELDGDLGRRGCDVAAWDALLGTAQLEIPEVVARDMGQADFVEVSHLLSVAVQSLAPVFAWVFVAPLPELLALAPPSRAGLASALRRSLPDASIMEDYRWLVDRFSTTRVAEWADSSLQLEFKYLDGEAIPPCADGLMADRVAARDELAVEVARRAVYPRPESAGQYGSALAVQMQKAATDLLGEGRRREAAALFEFAVSQDPSSAAPLNNLAFCLLPDDPATAVVHLRKARALGYAPVIINVYNEALATCLQGHQRQALQLVEDHWDVLAGGAFCSGVLWRLREDGEVVLAEVDDVFGELVTLCVRLADLQGGDVAQRWLARKAD